MGSSGRLGVLQRPGRNVRNYDPSPVPSVLDDTKRSLPAIPLTGTYSRLNQEITAFYRHVSPTKVEYEVRLFVIELIIRAVHHTWPEATVTPFGSWQTQLYLPTGYVHLHRLPDTAILTAGTSISSSRRSI
mgnify:CR=1 FL=1